MFDFDLGSFLESAKGIIEYTAERNYRDASRNARMNGEKFDSDLYAYEADRLKEKRLAREQEKKRNRYR
ncbi:hypothetical protein [Oribacterium sp. P6A1]|uniref:hypothetical protein n=1 Tax=Oribacterium sp. P6A1 TaxID=1410612 RepID=UPI00055A9213|nr:hypothetical protein [Oribacterium sp. P6A1]